MIRIVLRWVCPAVLFLAAVLPSIARAAEPAIWLAVGNAELLVALQPLADHRRAEGFHPVLSSEPIGKALADAGKPAFLLLVGDDAPTHPPAAWHLAAKRRKLYRWREEQSEEFVSDALWGDLDGDLAPDVPVGRLPARSAKQVAQAVEKILAYERRPASQADLRLPIWTGTPNYGAAIDALSTGLLLSTLGTDAPRWSEPWVLAGDPRHPLCGWPDDQPAQFASACKAHGAVSVLMGHGNETLFYSMARGEKPITLSASDVRGLWSEGTPTPAMVMFTCLNGNFAGREASLAESLFALPGGPVATIAATTESHPLTNYFSSMALLGRLTSGGEDRLGKLWWAAQRDGAKARSLFMESLLKDVEGKLEDMIDVEQLRRDQQLMYSLLGDPATRLPLPLPLTAKVSKTSTGWRWHAERPAGAGNLAVTHRPRTPALKPLEKPLTDAPAARAAALEANRTFVFQPLGEIPADSVWEGRLDQPGTLRLATVVKGRLHVAVFKLD